MPSSLLSGEVVSSDIFLLPVSHYVRLHSQQPAVRLGLTQYFILEHETKTLEMTISKYCTIDRYTRMERERESRDDCHEQDKRDCVYDLQLLPGVARCVQRQWLHYCKPGSYLFFFIEHRRERSQPLSTFLTEVHRRLLPNFSYSYLRAFHLVYFSTYVDGKCALGRG